MALIQSDLLRDKENLLDMPTFGISPSLHNIVVGLLSIVNLIIAIYVLLDVDFKPVNKEHRSALIRLQIH